MTVAIGGGSVGDVPWDVRGGRPGVEMLGSAFTSIGESDSTSYMIFIFLQ